MADSADSNSMPQGIAYKHIARLEAYDTAVGRALLAIRTMAAAGLLQSHIDDSREELLDNARSIEGFIRWIDVTLERAHDLPD